MICKLNAWRTTQHNEKNAVLKEGIAPRRCAEVRNDLLKEKVRFRCQMNWLNPLRRALINKIKSSASEKKKKLLRCKIHRYVTPLIKVKRKRSLRGRRIKKSLKARLKKPLLRVWSERLLVKNMGRLPNAKRKYFLSFKEKPSLGKRAKRRRAKKGTGVLRFKVKRPLYGWMTFPWKRRGHYWSKYPLNYLVRRPKKYLRERPKRRPMTTKMRLWYEKRFVGRLPLLWGSARRLGFFEKRLRKLNFSADVTRLPNKLAVANRSRLSIVLDAHRFDARKLWHYSRLRNPIFYRCRNRFIVRSAYYSRLKTFSFALRSNWGAAICKQRPIPSKMFLPRPVKEFPKRAHRPYHRRHRPWLKKK